MVESKDHTSTELNREISKESVEEEGIDKEADIGEEADESIALNETDVCTNDGEKEASRLKGIKIHHVIRDTILPQLHKSMAKKVSSLSFVTYLTRVGVSLKLIVKLI